MKKIGISGATAMGITGILLSVALLSMIAVPSAASAARKPPTQEVAYCAAAVDAKVFLYRISPLGALLPLNPPFVAAKPGAVNVIISRDKRFAYVPCIGNKHVTGVILTYRIEPDGILHLIQAPPAPFTNYPQGLLFRRGGHFVYTIEGIADGVLQYKVSADGSLKALSPPVVTTSHDRCTMITISPGGQALYAANLDGTLSQYRIGADGRLTPLTPAVLPAAPGPEAGKAEDMVLDASGKYAYVTSTNKDMSKPGFISLFEVGADGGLKYLSNIRGPVLPMVQRHDSILFIENGPIDQYHIDRDGQLTPIGRRLLAETPPSEIDSNLSFTPDNRFAYITNDEEETIAQFRFKPDGSLEPLATATVQTGQRYPMKIIIDPGGCFAYSISGWDGTIEGFKIGADGVLTALKPGISQPAPASSITFLQLPTPASHEKAARGKRH